MKRKYSYFTISLVGVLFIAVVRIFYLDFTESNSITVDDILAASLLFFSIRLVITGSHKGTYLIFGLILLSVSNILTGNIALSESNSISSSSFQIGRISFNAFAFLLMLFYILINRTALNNAFKTLLRGSESEQLEESDKMINFYYNKFNSCTPDELNNAFSMFEKYPVEARVALKKIKAEKKV